MASIYELKGQYKLLENAIAENPDDEELKELLDSISGDIENKADNYAKLIKNLEAIRDAKKAEAKRLTDGANSIDRNIDRLKANLMEAMVETGKTKFKTDLFNFGVQKNGGLEPLVVDVTVDEIPDEFIKVTKDVDKDALRKYIKETGDFSYGHFADKGSHLSIR